MKQQVWQEAWVVSAAAALKAAQSLHVLKVHLVVDTGLGREGCMLPEALPLAHAVPSPFLFHTPYLQRRRRCCGTAGGVEWLVQRARCMVDVC